jgi:Uma2 family endonuclease
MAESALKPMTPEEFFQWQLDQEERYELVDGFPVKKETGASERHDRLVVNITVSLGTQLRGTRCRPITPDVAVRTRIKGVRRPDITVACGEPRDDSYEAQEPKMVIRGALAIGFGGGMAAQARPPAAGHPPSTHCERVGAHRCRRPRSRL